jgi:1-acyl-sn-glycerol-3-phosphate acyltransferase
MDKLLPSPRQFFFVQRAFRVLFGGALDWHVSGLENVPRQGPLLVVLNHTSFLDVIVTGMFFPRPIVSFVKVEAFHQPGIGQFLRWMSVIPISRGEVDRNALRRALQVLGSGGAFAVAPEGTRTQEGKLIQAKPGVALLAVSTGAPIVPMGIWGGAQRGFVTNLKHLRRTHGEMVLGEPLRLREGVVASRESRQAIADELMLHIARLLPEEVRGYYGNPADFPLHYFEPVEPSSVES